MKVMVKIVCLLIVGVLTIQLWAGEAADLVTVVVTGVGKTEDAALKQAFNNAVTQVVGSIVDAETMVQNDKIIKEQILTYSNAIVTKYDPVGKPITTDGFVAVTIKAQVEKRVLTEKLTTSKVYTAKIEGKDLMARALTELKEEQDGAKMVDKLFAALPGAMILRVYGEPKVLTKTAEKVSLAVFIECSVDDKKYTEWCQSADLVLKKVAIRTSRDRFNYDELVKNGKIEVDGLAVDNKRIKDCLNSKDLVKIEVDSWGHIVLVPSEDYTSKKLSRQGWGSAQPLEIEYNNKNKYDKDNDLYVVVFNRQGNSIVNTYIVKKNVLGSVDGSWITKKQIASNFKKHEIVLSDASGAEISGQSVDFNPEYVNVFLKGYSNVLYVLPYELTNGIMMPRYIVQVTFDLPIDKLKEIKKVDIKPMETAGESKK